MEQPPRKRGRPRVVVTEAIIEQRRLAKQRSNAARRRGTVPAILSGPEDPSSTTSQAGAATGEARPVNTAPRNAAGDLVPDDAFNAGPSVKNNRVAGLETPRRRKNIDKKKRLFATSNTILDLGKPDRVCGFCQALVWDGESTGRHVGGGPKGYSICCGKGKVQLPFLRGAPPELLQLLTCRVREGELFHRQIRVYNNIFAFVSFGGNVDDSINAGRGPYVFRVRGHTYHSLGSLDPPPGCTPKFAQIYMYDGQEALEYRLQFPTRDMSLDPAVVSSLSEMLDRENKLVEIFKQIRERYRESDQTSVRVRLLEKRASDGRYMNLPTQNDYEFAGLVLDNDFVNKRDIVVERRGGGLERITDLHPCFMSLQYPLLFAHGEDGYRLNIKHRNVDISDNNKNNTVTSREYYAFRFQYREVEGHTLLLGGRLFLQFVVDAWCAVERSRLQWVREHQSIIRSDLYNNIVDSVRRGDVAASEVGKRVVLPSSFTGGYRYMQQNFQDSLAVCKEYGHPDLFITFTCNPKWEEIRAAVEHCGSRDASVRPDIVARVFKLKLDAMMADLTKNNVLGRVLAGEWKSLRRKGADQGLLLLMLFLSSADWPSNGAMLRVEEGLLPPPLTRQAA